MQLKDAQVGQTCVVEEIQNGNTQIVDEAVELIKKLK